MVKLSKIKHCYLNFILHFFINYLKSRGLFTRIIVRLKALSPILFYFILSFFDPKKNT